MEMSNLARKLKKRLYPDKLEKSEISSKSG